MEAFLEEFQYLRIQLQVIRSATDNFDNKNVIGKGGFGKVYKGVLSHYKGESMVAFKRLDRNYGQGDPEFWKEILMLSGYKHENLISLLGFCDEDGEKILVYEHASHGSLDRHLSNNTLMWRQRLKICLGAAIGLCYLHDPKETQQRVLHRDIKSSNILPDENWKAKLSDMGLSKIGPANQKHTFLVSNVVGTFGYINPMYMDTSILTKESDVYSFGVVLFEVLCGRLCFDFDNGNLQSVVQMWKKCYKQKKVDCIIFQDLKDDMDPSSLETFLDISNQCLHKSREERPKMSDVVEKLAIALHFQETSEVVEPPMDYRKMIKSVVPPLVYRSEEELKILLSKGILVNGEKQFSMGYYRSSCLKFKTHVRTQFLSPHITYTVNLVFSIGDPNKDYLGFSYTLAGETKSSTSYIADKREDGWLMSELYQFTSKSRNIDLEITFLCKDAIALEGIEFQPLEKEEHQVIEDEEVDMQTVPDSDTYWEQKLPSDYEEIIKQSKESLQWTTKEELYSIFCKGFPISYFKTLPGQREDLENSITTSTHTSTFVDSLWFSLAKNGKKCHLLPARTALKISEWKWQSLPESRFEEVAFGHRHGFRIICISGKLSPQTTYASYLVYKLLENNSAPLPPVKVRISLLYGYPNHARYTYIRGPQTPILRPNDYQNTHNALNRPKIDGLPQRRNDGWMEVQVWKFQTGATEYISENLQLTFSDKSSLTGIIVEGIEFKPI